MMDSLIPISYLNDFIFCPVSIYFHQLYGNQPLVTYQCRDQLKGTAAHKAIEEKRYSTRKNVIQAIPVYSERLGLIGKIDIFDEDNGILTERKRQIKHIYDGYIFQLYAQFYCLTEMGYKVKKLRLYSVVDNHPYNVKLPDEDIQMKAKFYNLLKRIASFDVESYKQTNQKKCEHCIYEPACGRSL
jgi:CRISPR-associated exonuclease Cas4